MSRWHALDRLRALAVLLMVQGHTTTALMRRDALGPTAGGLHALLHGMTAPAFLFGAGLAFGITSFERYEHLRTPGPATNKRFRRYLTLLAIGYGLQLPGASLWAAFHVQGERLALVCRVGPLQLIALTLGLCQLAIWVLPTPRAHALLFVGLAALIAAVSTRIASSGLSAQLAPLLAAFIDDRTGSQFPIFPWASFAFLGVAAAFALRHGTRCLPAWLLTYGGALLAALAYVIFYYRLAPYDPYWFWRTSPVCLLFRLGMVLMLLGLLQRRSDGHVTTRDGVSAILARHSLVAYVFHLLLLYGTPLTPNLVHAWGGSLNVVETALASALVLLATIAAVYAWHALEQQKTWLQRVQRVGLAGACLIVLLMR